MKQESISTTTGVVKSLSCGMYTVELINGMVCRVPFQVMHLRADLSNLVCNGRIPDNTEMWFYVKDMSSGTIYPDIRTYGVLHGGAQTSNSSKLLEGVQPYEQLTGFSDFMTDLRTNYLVNLDTDNFDKVMRVLESRLTQDEQQKIIRSMLNMSVSVPPESKTVEWKSSLLFKAGAIETEAASSGNLQEITEQAVAFANTEGHGEIIVGINKNGNPCGLENELALYYPHLNLDQIQNTVISNFIHDYVNDSSFMKSLSFKWRNFNGHLLLIISVDYKGLPILIGNAVMPYRSESSMRKASGKDMVRLIYNSAIADFEMKQALKVNINDAVGITA